MSVTITSAAIPIPLFCTPPADDVQDCRTCARVKAFRLLIVYDVGFVDYIDDTHCPMRTAFMPEMTHDWWRVKMNSTVSCPHWVYTDRRYRVTPAKARQLTGQVTRTIRDSHMEMLDLADYASYVIPALIAVVDSLALQLDNERRK